MSSKPKKQGPSRMDRANASVAVARKRRFDSLYGPLLKQMRDDSGSDDVKKVARSRANADVAQQITTPNLRAVNDVQRTAGVTQAYQGQLGQANAQANEITNKRQTGVLAVANKQEADTTRGMSLVSKLSTSEALSRARAKQVVDTARTQALGEVGTAATLYGMDKAGFIKA